MISLRKYALLSAFLGAAVGNAQTVPTKGLPAAEMRVEADAIKQAIDDTNHHVLHLQALARKEKDVIKLTCVDDKLVQLNAQMDLYDTASLQLDASKGNADDTGAATAFTEIQKVDVDVKKLRGEADGCAGALEMYKQESASDFTRPDLDDPTAGQPFNNPEQVGDPQVDVPGFATPFK